MRGRREGRLITKRLSKISSFCAWKPNRNPPFSHVLAQRLTNTTRRNLQVAMGRKRIPAPADIIPSAVTRGLSMVYIFLIWEFFFVSHEICAFANELRSFLVLIGQLPFSCFTSSRTMEIKAGLLSELYIHINSSKAVRCAGPAPLWESLCPPLTLPNQRGVCLPLPQHPPPPFSSRNVVALMIRL